MTETESATVGSRSGGLEASGLRAVLSTCILMFLTSLDATIVNVGLPAIQHGLRVPTGSLGWTVEAYSIPFATLMLSGGALSDRIGPGRAFMTGVITFGIGSVINAAAPIFLVLTLGRVVQGVSAAICVPSALAVLRSAVPVQKLGRAVAQWAFSGSIAISMGPILGGALIQFASWRSIFLINIPIVLFAVVLVLPELRRSREQSSAVKRTRDVVGQALYVGSSGLLVGGLLLVNAETGAARRQVPMMLLALGVIGFVTFYVCERRAANPVLPPFLMKMRAFESAAIVGGSVNVVNFGLLFCLGLYYGGTHGYSALKSGILFLPMMVCTGVSTMVVERIRRALGDRATVITGLLLEIVGAILIGDRPGSAAWVSASTSFIGLGVGLVVPPITTGLLRSVDPKVSGVASGAFSSIRQFGSALGVAVLGLMVHGDGTSVRVELRPISVVCGVLLVIALTTYTISSGLKKAPTGAVLRDDQPG